MSASYFLRAAKGRRGAIARAAVGWILTTGGGGDDIFLFGAAASAGIGSRRDTIRDFERGGDEIDLSAIDANEGRVGNQSFDFVGGDAFDGHARQLRFSGGVLSGDTDGDGGSDFQVAVADVPRLGEADFIL